MLPHTRSDSYKRGQRIRRWILFSFALLLFAGILGGSLLPGSVKQVLHTRGRFHSWFHALAFGALAFAGVRGASSSRARMLFFIAALSLGWGTEQLEFLAYHAPFEWHDVFVDSFGITVATLLALLF